MNQQNKELMRKDWHSSNFTPPAVNLWRGYRSLREEGKSVKESLSGLHVGEYLVKLATTLAINRLTARYLGFGAWDPKLSGQLENRMQDSSPLALAVSATVTSAVPPYMANYATALEFALCIPRMWVEQKAFKAVGITPDPAGLILTPYSAGALEVLYKGYEVANIYGNHMDPKSQIMVAVNGMFGSVVRMVEAGLIIAVAAVFNRNPAPERANAP